MLMIDDSYALCTGNRDERGGVNRKTKDLGGFASDLLYSGSVSCCQLRDVDLFYNYLMNPK